jgi:translation initiation factor 3 subunit G
MSWASQARAGSSSWADDAEAEEQRVAEGKDIEPIPEFDDTGLKSSAEGGGFADVKAKDLPPNTETYDEATGIKTITEYKLNGKGQRVKVTKRFKVETKSKQLRKGVVGRRSFPKFGHAYDYIEKTLGESLGNRPPTYQGVGYQEEGVTFFPDPVFLDLTPKAKVEKKTVDVSDGPTVGSVVVCRICGMTGDHWTLKCPNKEKIASGRMTKIGGDAGGSSSVSSGDGIGGLSRVTGKYVPPSLRNGDGSRMADTSYAQRDDSNTLRVSNLSEETRESDLQELFRAFGPISRTYLAKDRETQASRGFAFVTFMRREDAQRAMDRLAGYGYDHLILQIEWAQPSKPR